MNFIISMGFILFHYFNILLSKTRIFKKIVSPKIFMIYIAQEVPNLILSLS